MGDDRGEEPPATPSDPGVVDHELERSAAREAHMQGGFVAPNVELLDARLGEGLDEELRQASAGSGDEHCQARLIEAQDQFLDALQKGTISPGQPPTSRLGALNQILLPPDSRSNAQSVNRSLP